MAQARARRWLWRWGWRALPGTDTAGSGRSGSLNNLVGLKATKGLISTAGVVPACRTLDCVTFFTSTAAEASQLLALTATKDAHDDYSRANPSRTERRHLAYRQPVRFGVPDTLEFLGCAESEALYYTAKERLIALGGVPVTIDFSPFPGGSKTAL